KQAEIAMPFRPRRARLEGLYLTHAEQYFLHQLLIGGIVFALGHGPAPVGAALKRHVLRAAHAAPQRVDNLRNLIEFRVESLKNRLRFETGAHALLLLNDSDTRRHNGSRRDKAERDEI